MGSTAIEHWIKTPTEAKIFEFEVPAADLASGETLATAQYTSTPTSSGINWGTEAISGRFVQSKATGGTVDVEYHVTLTVTTSLGQTLEYCGNLSVLAC